MVVAATLLACEKDDAEDVVDVLEDLLPEDDVLLPDFYGLGVFLEFDEAGVVLVGGVGVLVADQPVEHGAVVKATLLELVLVGH